MSVKETLGSTAGIAAVAAAVVAGGLAYFLYFGQAPQRPVITPETPRDAALPAEQAETAQRSPQSEIEEEPAQNTSAEEESPAPQPATDDEEDLPDTGAPADLAEDIAAERPAMAEQAEAAQKETEEPSASETDGEEASQTIELPHFSDMRLDADGTAVIAGTAPAGFEVQVRERDATLASAEANASGDFAMVFDLSPTGRARVLFLVALDAAGREYRSEQSAILTPPVAPAPVPEEVDVASADMIAPDPAPLPTQAGVSNMPGVPEGDAPPEAAGEPTMVQPEIAELSGPDGVPQPDSREIVQDTETDRAGLAMQAQLPVEDGGAETLQSESGGAEVQQSESGQQRPILSEAGEAVVESPVDDAADTATPTQSEEATPTQIEHAAEPAQTALVAEQSRPVASEDGAVSDATPTVLLAGHDGVELLQPANTSVDRLRDRVVIDVISYSDDGSVTLSGRAAMAMPRADRVQVYLNNKPVQTTEVARDGSWKMRLPPVKPGIYTLRVDQVDAAGKVVARFETPFKREDPSDLARMTPTNLSPNGVAASVITVQPGYTLWGIATDRYGSGFDYVQIFRANRDQIRDPDLIYPGQVFDLPDKEGSGWE